MEAILVYTNVRGSILEHPLLSSRGHVPPCLSWERLNSGRGLLAVGIIRWWARGGGLALSNDGN